MPARSASGSPTESAPSRRRRLARSASVPPPRLATAGQEVGQLTVSLSATAPSGEVTVNLATSSSGGGFSTSSSGPLSNTLQLPVAGGASLTESFYYEDIVAGTPTGTATAAAWTTGNLPVTVNPGVLASITVNPSSATVPKDATQTFTAAGADAYGNPVTVNPTWTTTTGSDGTVSPLTGSFTVFTAGSATVTSAATVRNGPNYRTSITFSGPVPTASIASALAGLEINDHEGDTIRHRLHNLTTALAEGIRDRDLQVSNANGFPILTVRFGSPDNVLDACRTLRGHGILITPTVFPAVPLRQGGDRFSVTAADTETDIERALTALAAARNTARTKHTDSPLTLARSSRPSTPAAPDLK